MDLALELGIGTVAELKHRMLHSERLDWLAYAQKRLLPTRRIEIYLARLAQRFAGGTLDEHLLHSPEDEPATSDSKAAVNVLGAVSGLGVRMLGQGRKKKGAADGDQLAR